MRYLQWILYRQVFTSLFWLIWPYHHCHRRLFHITISNILGASLQGNFTINKIQVIPKRKSQQLFEGTIYIIEDLWCLQSVDLTNENLVGKIRIQQLYIPVQDDIWMPVSHKFEINIGIIGFKADAGYGSSVKYLDVKPNLALQKPDAISTDYLPANCRYSQELLILLFQNRKNRSIKSLKRMSYQTGIWLSFRD